VQAGRQLSSLIWIYYVTDIARATAAREQLAKVPHAIITSRECPASQVV